MHRWRGRYYQNESKVSFPIQKHNAVRQPRLEAHPLDPVQALAMAQMHGYCSPISCLILVTKVGSWFTVCNFERIINKHNIKIVFCSWDGILTSCFEFWKQTSFTFMTKKMRYKMTGLQKRFHLITLKKT